MDKDRSPELPVLAALEAAPSSGMHLGRQMESIHARSSLLGDVENEQARELENAVPGVRKRRPRRFVILRRRRSKVERPLQQAVTEGTSSKHSAVERQGGRRNSPNTRGAGPSKTDDPSKRVGTPEEIAASTDGELPVLLLDIGSGQLQLPCRRSFPGSGPGNNGTMHYLPLRNLSSAETGDLLVSSSSIMSQYGVLDHDSVVRSDSGEALIDGTTGSSGVLSSAPGSSKASSANESATTNTRLWERLRETADWVGSDSSSTNTLFSSDENDDNNNMEATKKPLPTVGDNVFGAPAVSEEQPTFCVSKNIGHNKREAVASGLGMRLSSFRPAGCAEAAPITHVGGDAFCLMHRETCEWNDAAALRSLWSPEHSTRPFCNCLNELQLDKAFAMETYERELVADAYLVTISIARRYGWQVVERDPCLAEIVFRYEAVVNFYRLLAEVDFCNSRRLLANLLRTELAAAAPSQRPFPRRNFHGTPLACSFLDEFEFLGEAAGSEDFHPAPSDAGSDIPGFPRRQQVSALHSGRRGNRTHRIPASGGASDVEIQFPVAMVTSTVTDRDSQDADLRGTPSLESEGASSPGPLGSQFGMSTDASPLPQSSPEPASSKRLRRQRSSKKPDVASGGDSRRARRRRASGAPSAPPPWRHVIDNGLGCQVWCRALPGSTGVLFRLEGQVEASMLDILSVASEVDLSPEWIPFFKIPIRLGLERAAILSRNGRFDKCSEYEIAMPWPFRKRYAIVHGWMIDDLERNQSIVVTYRSVGTGSVPRRFAPMLVYPESPKNAVPVQFDGGMALTQVSESISYLRLIFLVDLKEAVSGAIVDFFAGRFLRMGFGSFCKQCKDVGKRKASSFVYRQSKDHWFYPYLTARFKEMNQFRQETACRGEADVLPLPENSNPSLNRAPSRRLKRDPHKLKAP